MIRQVARGFVPVAVDCGAQGLVRAQERFFARVAEQGHYAGRVLPTATRQGLYACTAEGVLLASCNTTDAGEARALLERAARAWAEGPGGADAPPAAPEPDAAPETPLWRFPDGGLALEICVRDLPRADAPPDPSFNLDFAWLTREEARGLQPCDPRPGAVHPVPEALARRLARFHLVDRVRGEAPGWRPGEVQALRLVTRVESSGPERLALALEGRARLEAPPSFERNPYSGGVVDRARGLALRLQGRIEIDPARGAVTRFDAVACGARWGAAKHNRRFDDPGPAPIGFAIALAPPAEAAPPARTTPAEYFAIS